MFFRSIEQEVWLESHTSCFFCYGPGKRRFLPLKPVFSPAVQGRDIDVGLCGMENFITLSAPENDQTVRKSHDIQAEHKV